uniref:Reverse transcriptase zinc-binding domain-containing protein n=1 Tax=Arundo donax TaxID=35708 RepID=A0A0A9HC95_ARUDO
MSFELQLEVEDKHYWWLSASGRYSAKSAYDGFFLGSTSFEPWERIWRTWAPAKCRFFLWLVAHNRCWMADRLARRGLPHPDKCPLCDQEGETINHLLVSCVFAYQFWFHLLRHVGLHFLTPQPAENCFESWWRESSEATSGLVQQGLNSLIVLGAWTLWNHRNHCVFDGTAPSLSTALNIAGEERRMWGMAGARGLSLLTAPIPGD